jgi:nitrite reductase (NADH) large subunit
MQQRILIVGNGMASVRLVEHLVRLAPGRHAITVVGAEPQPGYNRVLLSSLLAGDVSEPEVALRDRDWYAGHGIRLITGQRVTALDAQGRVAHLASGESIGFDHCVLATGSEAIRLPIPGMALPGVMTFRDLSDVAAMDAAGAARQHVAVIGGGLLGIEAAYGLVRRGATVTLVHVMDRLMERQLDAPAAALLRRKLERRGVRVLLSRQTVAVSGEDRATGLVLADGSTLAADLIVCAVGIRPEATLARAAGAAVQRGIVIDDHMATTLPGVHALGECAEHRGIAYGLVEPAYAQGEALARRLCGLDGAFTGMVLATNLKVSGVPVFSAGEIEPGEGAECATMLDQRLGHYRKLIFRGSRLVGCILAGEADDGLWYLGLIRDGTDISAARRAMLHGRTFAEAALNTPSLAASALAA